MNRDTLQKARPRRTLLLAVLLAAGIYSGAACLPKKAPFTISDNASLTKLLTEVKQERNQPAMAIALVHHEKIIAEATVGTAVYGQDQPVHDDSRFHLGSTTKSMTALLVAMFVKEGILKYETTLAQVLPDMRMRDEYRTVTIADLLNNRAGIIAFQLTTLEDPAVVEELMKEIPTAWPDPTDQRREATKLALGLPPIAPPGTKVIYSNVGWPIVGHVLEKTAGQSYEDLLRRRIFEPLGMKTARVGGWPASAAEPDQPRGHYPGQGPTASPKPQDLDDQYTLAPWMSPSGGVHCSIHDLALYAQEHLLGLKGQGKLFDQDSYQTLHAIQVTTNLRDMYPHMKQDREASFGYGWGIIKEQHGHVSIVSGSGGTFFARIQVDPVRDYAFVGFTNCGNGGKALDDLLSRIVGP